MLNVFFSLVLSIFFLNTTLHGMVQGNPPPQAINPIQGIHKINDDLYVGKKGDLYFALERLTWSNHDFWDKYILTQKEQSKRGIPGAPPIFEPATSFERSLGYMNMDDVWIAHVGTRDMTKISTENPLNLEGDIEMSFTVMTNADLPFSTHMGIFRAAEFYRGGKPIHKNLAMQLHSFAAKAVKAAYGNKYYMITKPVGKMREIMLSGLPQEGVWVGDGRERDRFHARKNLLEQYQQNPQTIDLETYLKLFNDSKVVAADKKIKTIEKVRNSIPNYANAQSFLEDVMDYFSSSPFKKETEIHQDLSLVLQEIEEGRLSSDAQLSPILEIFQKWENHYKLTAVEFIKNEEGRSKESLKWQFSLYFPHGEIEDSSPFINQDEEKWGVTKPSGEIIWFRKPTFYGHNDLNIYLPSVIINLDVLAGIMQLDPQ